ncbi:hypothetical protein MY04_4575 [Flammeovirga sp. MY04]|uniref:RHS repeat domain-containing protein n=1 Tax=Flammeovirga sp. MY04 TaxID=1191459 RepID=UPI0008064096|nr:RHS repeat-associated core domain-containing protein [Flammeovirga sp. MY04]ANQ51910.1 hypothetical protein MY04_4575 [Flammeovirga sp. MY04]
MAIVKNNTITEIPIYGSSRIGQFEPSNTHSSSSIGTAHHKFEYSNHLGNVLATTDDLGNVLSYSDYYPFGLSMESRSWSDYGYRYGFNGKENDTDLSSSQLIQQDYGFRVYNPVIGKFLSVDPLTKSYPWYTPYQFAGNKPIQAIDLDGLEEYELNNSPYLREIITGNPKLMNPENDYLTLRNYLWDKICNETSNGTLKLKDSEAQFNLNYIDEYGNTYSLIPKTLSKKEKYIINNLQGELDYRYQIEKEKAISSTVHNADESRVIPAAMYGYGSVSLKAGVYGGGFTGGGVYKMQGSHKGTIRPYTTDTGSGYYDGGFYGNLSAGWGFTWFTGEDPYKFSLDNNFGGTAYGGSFSLWGALGMEGSISRYDNKSEGRVINFGFNTGVAPNKLLKLKSPKGSINKEKTEVIKENDLSE